MTDPFDALREPVTPVDPDPGFAEALRARVRAALLQPQGATVSTQSSTASIFPTVGPIQGDVTYASLWLPDAQLAERFYAGVLGWQFARQRHQVTGLRQHLGMWGGVSNPTMMLCLAVDDLAEAVARVRAAGGTAGDPQDEPYGRIAECVDDQGMEFALHESPVAQREPAPAPEPGEVSYLTIEVPDSARFRAFFGTVLGWRFTPGRIEDGWEVADLRPMTGMHGGVVAPVVVPMYSVADIEAAVAAVRAAGGTATDPDQQPYGRTSTCVDDQGSKFYLGEH